MDAQREAEFRDFVVAQWHALARTAFLLTGDRGDAEDLVQSALVRVHRHWARIENTDAPYAYTRRVMVNLNIAAWRRRRLLQRPVAVLPDRGGPDDVAAYDLHDALVRACRTLPPRMRAVLVLRYFEDLPEAEVAAMLGISLGAVKSQTSRALDRLRDVLGEPAGLSAGPPAAAAASTDRPTTTDGRTA